MNRYRQSCGIVFSLMLTLLLAGCGGKAATPKWIDEDTTSTNLIVVLSDGTQLVNQGSGNLYVRASDGSVQQNLSIAHTSLQWMAVRNDQVLMYGRDGSDVWRVVLDNQLQPVSDDVIYTGSNVTALWLQQIGDEITLYWSDDGVFTYYREGGSGVQQLAPEQTFPIYRLATGGLYWGLDKTDVQAPILTEVDLASQTTLGTTTLPPDFAAVTSVYVNDGFVVGVIPSSAHDGVDLLIWDRNTQALTTASSQGNFGHFDLQMMGQDGTGTLYYRYAAFLPHAGFSSGTHVRAISNISVKAWDYKLGTSSEFVPAHTVQLLADGVRYLYRDAAERAIANPDVLVSRTTTTRYVQLTSTREVVRSFYLSPVVESITPFISQFVATSGYDGRAMGTDQAGNVYIYGTKVPAVGKPVHYFAAQY